jgi:hypothetical protein
MRVIASWALAAMGVALCAWRWGWPGVLLGTGVVVFWLLLQFSRALRALQAAGRAPVGRVPNAVMLHAKLRPGMKLMQMLPLTGCLGAKLDGPDAGAEERFRWQDAAGDGVEVTLVEGRLARWQLTRAQAPTAEPAGVATEAP